MTTKPHHLARWRALFLLGWSALLIGIFSYSSPLYDFNYTGDNNNYLTVGKALMHGLVTYRDVFEQKGPYVYLLYGIASRISFTTFWGAAVLEVLGLWLILLGTQSLARRWFTSRGALIIASAAPLLVLMEPYYSYGGTVEFWVYPAVLSAFLVVVTAQQLPDLSRSMWLGQGVLVGVVFLSKYSLLGTWVAFFGFLTVWLMWQRNWLGIWRMVQGAGTGFLLSVVPWLWYFTARHGLSAFVRVYFVDNLTLYSKNQGTPLVKILHSGAALGHFLVVEQPGLLLLVVVGLIWLARFSTFATPTKWLLVTMMLSGAVLALYGGQFGPYYDLAYFPSILVCAIWTLVAIRNWKVLANLQLCKIPFKRTMVVALGGIFVGLLLVNQNPWMSRLVPNNPSVTLHPTSQRQVPAQIQFGRIMRNESHGRPTLLTFDFLENGFYLTSGAYPTVYFFEKNNIPEQKLPAMLATGVRALRRKQVEWVVLATPPTAHWEQAPNLQTRGGRAGISAVHQNYHLVATHSQLSQGNPTKYWLFRRN
ncbi:hypothetical protein M8332_02685 [Fructilactobacillus ixorae]|uniref:Glycosyltransferase RgtA/B/C/D-like domain-containing protein n=1 Tax=Fructilactobacillus ixorae TaxID=1750535 RepID=A0ABY5C4S8_9LACO|nr:hypothetical protein [Fructilactobacillus ixorae]USS93774.1 hypothetical protein M8332_02685 [Fructilactobacillus ixorae]